MPSEISARGWKDILIRVYRNISEHRVVALAAGVTFYSLLAIFPAIAALVAGLRAIHRCRNPRRPSREAIRFAAWRRARRPSGSTDAGRVAARQHARIDFPRWARSIALERQRSDEVDLRHPQHR